MSEPTTAHTTQTLEASSKPTPTNDESSKTTKPINEAPSKPTNEESAPKPIKTTDEASSKSTDRAHSQSMDTRDISPKVSQVRTVKVSNVSLKTDKVELREFFSFSGDIQYVELQKESETTQIAFVTYKDPKGAETALCLSGATISDLRVTITPMKNYQLPPDAVPLDSDKNPPSNAQKAEDVMTTMLARGFVLGKDTLNMAKDFDERHQLSSKASDRVVSIDRRIGFTEKLSQGTAAVNEKAREVDQKYQVSEKTKQAYQVAEEKATSAGNAIMSNKYVMTGATWVTNAYSAVARAAEDVSAKTKEKVERAELERQERLAAMSPNGRGRFEKAEKERQKKMAAMSPHSRGRFEREEEEREKAEAKAMEKTEAEAKAKKDGGSECHVVKEEGEKVGENKNVSEGALAGATNPGNSGDGKGVSK